MTEPSYKDWYAGMRIVCVEDEEFQEPEGYYPDKPMKGVVYTVEAIWPFELDSRIIMVGLNEFRKRWQHRLRDGRVLRYGFDARYFRPVLSRKSDISVFTALLNPAKWEEWA